MKRYNFFSNRIYTSNPKRNLTWIKKVEAKLGNNGLFTLYRLEEKIYATALCNSQLKYRSKRFSSIVKIEDYFGGPIIKKNHAYEYFFFTCCGYVYKEIKNASLNTLSSKLNNLYQQLKTLNDERRVQEHGKEWSWGEARKNNPPVSSKGDNYDFNKNMTLLDDIYSELKQIIK